MNPKFTRLYDMALKDLTENLLPWWMEKTVDHECGGFYGQVDDHDRPIADGYAAFCASLDKALNIAADEMEDRTGDDELADAAIHFALMSYAAGVASSRYVSLLRQRKQAQEAEAASRGKEKSKKDKERD